MPQLRQNIITGDWVVIAPERAKRPTDFITADTVRKESKVSCLFCLHGKVYKQENLKEFETKNVYVVKNKFPAFVENLKFCSPRSYKIENDFYRVKPSVGGHDVIVIKEHEQHLPKFTVEIWQELLLSFRRRYDYFRKTCNVEYSMAIYNHGAEAGQSIEHPHAQLFASNIVPNLVTKEIHGSQRYFEKNGQCVFCNLIEHEERQKIRILYNSPDFLAFTFYAARFPFEIWILPKNHESTFEHQNKDLDTALSKCLIEVLGQLNKTLNDPSLNIFFHTTPNSLSDTKFYHWHLEIAPRLAKYGGFELGSQVIIDVVSPEKAAQFLRGEEK